MSRKWPEYLNSSIKTNKLRAQDRTICSNWASVHGTRVIQLVSQKEASGTGDSGLSGQFHSPICWVFWMILHIFMALGNGQNHRKARFLLAYFSGGQTDGYRKQHLICRCHKSQNDFNGSWLAFSFTIKYLFVMFYIFFHCVAWQHCWAVSFDNRGQWTQCHFVKKSTMSRNSILFSIARTPRFEDLLAASIMVRREK